jgi:hypothetical protein
MSTPGFLGVIFYFKRLVQRLVSDVGLLFARLKITAKLRVVLILKTPLSGKYCRG